MPALEQVKGGLTKKVGPLPVWGWVAVSVGGGLAVYWLFLRGDDATTAPAGRVLMPTGSSPPAGGSSSGSGTGSGGTGSAPGTPSTPPPAAAPRPTNIEWLDRAIAAVTTAIGLPVDQVRLYLQQYLGGTGPVGNPAASTAFNRVVQAAIQAVGRPPNEPGLPNVNVNPFASNANWWANARGYLSGFSGAVIQELNNLFAGTSQNISQQALDALNQARSILGNEPTALAYGVLGPPETVSLSQIQQLWASAKRLLDGGVSGSQLNLPESYLPLYRASFPGLADEQLVAIQNAVKGLFAGGVTSVDNPDWGLIQRTVAGIIESGARMAVPGTGGAPVIPTPPTPPTDGFDAPGRRFTNSPIGPVRA